MRRAGIVVICSLLLFGCSKDPHDIRITAKDKDEKTQAARQQRLADEAKAKADALAAELRKSIDLTIYDKGFILSSNQIAIKCAYQNSSTKDIRAFRGKIQFTDLFGFEIFTTTLIISDPIAAGKKGNWFLVIEHNEFVRSHHQLFNTELKGMKVIWIPEVVIFADGSKIGEGQLRRESDSPHYHRPNPHPQLPSDPRQA